MFARPAKTIRGNWRVKMASPDLNAVYPILFVREFGFTGFDTTPHKEEAQVFAEEGTARGIARKVRDAAKAKGENWRVTAIAEQDVRSNPCGIKRRLRNPVDTDELYIVEIWDNFGNRHEDAVDASSAIAAAKIVGHRVFPDELDPESDHWRAEIAFTGKYYGTVKPGETPTTPHTVKKNPRRPRRSFKLHKSSPRGTQQLTDEVAEQLHLSGYEAAGWAYSNGVRETDTETLFIDAIHVLRDSKIPLPMNEETPQFWEYFGWFKDGATDFAQNTPGFNLVDATTKRNPVRPRPSRERRRYRTKIARR